MSRNITSRCRFYDDLTTVRRERWRDGAVHVAAPTETPASQNGAKGWRPPLFIESPIASQDAIAFWIANEILPHEAEVRGWLRRALRRVDPDDVIQETYCRIAATADPTTVINSRAYFFAAARNVAIDQMRRNRIVGLDDVAEIALTHVIDEAPSPERLVAGRLEWRRAAALIESLPEKCRIIFTLRKVHGLSQREIARRLGVSENIVEKQTARGLRRVADGHGRGGVGRLHRLAAQGRER